MLHCQFSPTLGTTATISPALSWRAFSSELVKSANTLAYSNWPDLASTMNWLTRSLIEAALAVLTTMRPPVLREIWRLWALMVLTSPMSSKLKNSTTWIVECD